MFGSSQPKPRKKGNIFVTTVHCIVFTLNMGLGINLGFVIDQWFRPVFSLIPDIQGFPIGGVLGFLVAIISGGAIGLGSYGLFIHTERAWKTIGMLSENDTELWVRRGALIALNFIWIIVGILGLAFRLQFLTEHGIGFLFFIGAFLDLTQPLYGLVLYPMLHIPAEQLEQERLADFQRTHVEELYNTLDTLPTHQKHRAFIGLGSGNEDEVLDVLEEDIAVKQARDAMRNRRRPQQAPLTRKRTQPIEDDEQDFPTTLPENQNKRVSR